MWQAILTNHSQIIKNPRAQDRLSRPVPSEPLNLEKENPFVYNFLNIKCSTFCLSLKGENAATFLSGDVAQNRLQIRKHGRKPLVPVSHMNKFSPHHFDIPEFWHLVLHHHTCSWMRKRVHTMRNLRDCITMSRTRQRPTPLRWNCSPCFNRC